MGRWYVSALPREHLVKAWRLQSDCAMLDMYGKSGAWVIRWGSRSTRMSPTMTGEHGPQPDGRAWILARAASLSRGARVLLAGARDIWTTLKG